LLNPSYDVSVGVALRPSVDVNRDMVAARVRSASKHASAGDVPGIAGDMLAAQATSPLTALRSTAGALMAAIAPSAMLALGCVKAETFTPPDSATSTRQK
jgi:hypothetical protein